MDIIKSAAGQKVNSIQCMIQAMMDDREAPENKHQLLNPANSSLDWANAVTLVKKIRRYHLTGGFRIWRLSDVQDRPVGQLGIL